jgi:hypothetical protein
MSTAIRILAGIGLLTFGFYLGRAVGRAEPITEELRAMKRRRGVIIEGAKVEPPREAAARS